MLACRHKLIPIHCSSLESEMLLMLLHRQCQSNNFIIEGQSNNKVNETTRHRRCLCLGGMLCIHACLTKYAELKYTSSNESLLLLVEHYVSD